MSSRIVDAVAPTFGVLFSWAVIAAVVTGCGFLARRGLLRLLVPGTAREPVVADFWIGLAVVVGYLQLWSLVWAVGWPSWLPVLVVGAAGLSVVTVRLVRGTNWRQLSLPAIALICVAVVWTANRALAKVWDYDTGLYHLGIVQYALNYPVVPGLGNLHERLGAGDGHLLLVAFLSHGPWAGRGIHLTNGLVAAMLFVEIGSRFARHTATPVGTSFTLRLALLLAPATVVVIGLQPGVTMSGGNLDFATFVCVAVGFLYVAGSVEHGASHTAAMAAASTLALAAVTRPLFWLSAVLALVAVALAAARYDSLGRRAVARLLGLSAVLPAVLMLGWLARQVVLSGYPLFPMTVAPIPVDWRVPAAVVNEANRWIYSWARHPGEAPDDVLGSWRWLWDWWLPTRGHDLMVVAPLLILFVAVGASLFRVGDHDQPQSRRTAAMLAVLVPSVLTVLIWFFVAPDPRFAVAPIWLTALAVAAWAIPSSGGRLSAPLIGLTVVVAGLLFVAGINSILYMLVVAVAVLGVILAFGLTYTNRGAWRTLAHAGVLSVLLASVAIVGYRGAFRLVAGDQAFRVVVPDQDGSIVAMRDPATDLVPYTTPSGLRLTHPADGDRCWNAMLCTPSKNRRVRMRGTTIAGGFATLPDR